MTLELDSNSAASLKAAYNDDCTLGSLNRSGPVSLPASSTAMSESSYNQKGEAHSPLGTTPVSRLHDGHQSLMDIIKSNAKFRDQPGNISDHSNEPYSLVSTPIKEETDDSRLQERRPYSNTSLPPDVIRQDIEWLGALKQKGLESCKASKYRSTHILNISIPFVGGHLSGYSVDQASATRCSLVPKSPSYNIAKGDSSSMNLTASENGSMETAYSKSIERKNAIASFESKHFFEFDMSTRDCTDEAQHSSIWENNTKKCIFEGFRDQAIRECKSFPVFLEGER